jgi:hypothetical protein
MSMTIAIHQASQLLAGHATRHPVFCASEALLTVTLLGLFAWAAISETGAVPDAAPRGAAQQGAPPRDEEGRPDAPPSWVWDKRVSHDSMLYAFGVD